MFFAPSFRSLPNKLDIHADEKPWELFERRYKIKSWETWPRNSSKLILISQLRHSWPKAIAVTRLQTVFHEYTINKCGIYEQLNRSHSSSIIITVSTSYNNLQNTLILGLVWGQQLFLCNDANFRSISICRFELWLLPARKLSNASREKKASNDRCQLKNKKFEKIDFRQVLTGIRCVP